MMHVFTIMLVIAVVLLTATIFVIGLTVATEICKLRSAIEAQASEPASVHDAIMAIIERRADRTSDVRYDDGGDCHG